MNISTNPFGYRRLSWTQQGVLKYLNTATYAQMIGNWAKNVSTFTKHNPDSQVSL